jgi:Zn-dependent M28 family amino/carboxypeptidase
MKKILLLLALITNVIAFAQKEYAIINSKEVERIENVLAADDMQGRRAGSPGIDKAAKFIADEFKAAGLQSVSGTSYLQEFVVMRPKTSDVKGEIDEKELDPKNIVVISHEKEFKVNEKSGFEIQYINAGENYNNRISAILNSDKNIVVFVDTSFSRNIIRLNNRRFSFARKNNIVFILGTYQPKEFNVKADQTFEEQKLSNVVGILPGKSKKNEYVIFSAHYDHIGIGKPVDGDSIYNGANDDAAGTTAVIMLAKYFKALNNNERTLIFATFTAEESGGYGAQYFSKQYNPKDVMAMFNIEMIGTESKWGKNSAFITGYEKTNMGTILQENLKGTNFTFHPDPYPDQQLFYRSDNATLARLGVPAHTISTSKMDSEPNYHKVSDEVETLDMQNMAEIIKAIAQSSKTIVSGKDTPTRVDTSTLR